MELKRTKTVEKKIGECTFYLTPFPAFTAANISGDLAKMLLPAIGALVPVIAETMKAGNTENVMDLNLEDMNATSAVPAISSALSSMGGEQIERFMKKLLIEHQNISVESDAYEITLKRLDMDTANEVFCGDLQDMYALCFEVIKLNFGGFFKNLGTQFGSQLTAAMTAPSTKNTESSM